MASGKRTSSSAGSAGRRRRAPTIELTATEIESGAKAAAEASASTAAADSRPESESAHGAPQSERPQAEESQGPSANAPTDPSSDEDKSIWWSRFHFLKSPLGAGLVGGVGVVAVILAFWIAGLVHLGADDAASLTGRLTVLEVQVRDLNDRMSARAIDPKTIDNLLARLISLETKVAAQKTAAIDPEFAKRIAAAENAAKAANSSVKSLVDRTTGLDRRINDSAVAARHAGERAAATAVAAAQLEKTVASIRTGGVTRDDIDRLSSRIAKLENELKTTRDALARRAAGSGTDDRLASRIAKLENEAKGMQDALARRAPADATDDRAIRLAVAAGALRTAVEGGRPFAAELAAVKLLSGDASALAPFAPFAAKGLPDKVALTRELVELLPVMRRAVGDAADDGGFLQRLQANAERLVRIRPINDATGDDPAAIIARIQVRTERADIAGALTELAKLPPAARAPAKAWTTKAKARLAAETLSRRFVAEAIAALGKTSP